MLTKKLLGQFCEYLDKATGLHFPKDRWDDLERKLVLIKSSFGFSDITPCLEWLMTSPIDKKKLDVLAFHLTIGETYFFRDAQLFTALEQHIIPDILHRHRSDKCIRIWSVGSCTGEEPYSIAMLLHRLLPDLNRWNISILGTDINSAFIHKAEQARYRKWSFRTTPAHMQSSYFKKNQDETYTLHPEIRNMVNFIQLNLVDHNSHAFMKDINEWILFSAITF